MKMRVNIPINRIYLITVFVYIITYNYNNDSISLSIVFVLMTDNEVSLLHKKQYRTLLTAVH